MNSQKRLLFCIICTLKINIILVILKAASAFAEPAEVPQTDLVRKENNDSSNKFRLYGETGMEYIDNVFSFNESQKAAMRENDPGDQVSGRYRNMKSISDYILTPRLGIIFNADNTSGDKLKIEPWFKYNYYFDNEKSSYPEAGIKIEQSGLKNGTLSLEGKLLKGYYKKNYILSFDDVNGNNNISKDERVYAGAVYDEYEGSITCDYRVIKKKESRSGIGLNISPFLGYGVRKYNSEFGNRDQEIILGGIGFAVGLKFKTLLNLTYKYERVNSPDENELVLADEESLGYDINEDGELDRNAALITNINRSSYRHSLEIAPSIKLNRKLLLTAGYKLRKTLYKSGNPLDLEHYGLSKYRHKLKAGIEYTFSKLWSIQLEYNKLDDEEDDDNYTQEGYSITLRYKWK
jgi:opacity protein-like surface antigen